MNNSDYNEAIEANIRRIQVDILDDSIPLSTILFRANVLAHQLGSEEFIDWVQSELEGYESSSALPSYRVIATPSVGVADHTDGRHSERTGIAISRMPPRLWESIAYVKVGSGIITIQILARSNVLTTYPWPVEWLLELNNVIEPGWHYSSATREIQSHVFEQMLTTIRARLQTFILKLTDLRWDISQGRPSEAQVSNLFQQVIVRDGAAFYNQPGQNVGVQQNAGRDITNALEQ